MKKNQFVGLGTALVTPFEKNGQISWGAIEVLVEKQILEGVDFLMPCGTTGESPTLTHAEHEEMIRFVVKKANSRVPVLAGTGSNATTEAISLTSAARAAGADGALIVSPYYNKPTQKGIMGYYRELAKVGLPIVLYDIPGRCGGQGVSSETILELAREGAIVGLKWASGNLGQLMEVLSHCPQDFIVLSGDDNLTFTAICLGAEGVISVVSNLIPKRMKDLVFSFHFGGMTAGRQQHYELLPLMQAMFIETNPIPVKAALAMMYPGVFKEAYRSPLCGLEETNKEKLRHLLDEYGLI